LEVVTRHLGDPSRAVRIETVYALRDLALRDLGDPERERERERETETGVGSTIGLLMVRRLVVVPRVGLGAAAGVTPATWVVKMAEVAPQHCYRLPTPIPLMLDLCHIDGGFLPALWLRRLLRSMGRLQQVARRVDQAFLPVAPSVVRGRVRGRVPGRIQYYPLQQDLYHHNLVTVLIAFQTLGLLAGMLMVAPVAPRLV
jgi:hypothetical protein